MSDSLRLSLKLSLRLRLSLTESLSLWTHFLPWKALGRSGRLSLGPDCPNMMGTGTARCTRMGITENQKGDAVQREWAQWSLSIDSEMGTRSGLTVRKTPCKQSLRELGTAQ